MMDLTMGNVGVTWRQMVFAGKALVLAAMLGGAGMNAAWGDWAEFQGPGRLGVSAEKNLADTWPAGGPREMWQINVGPGYGGASVRDGQVYVLDRQEDERDVLRCLDLETGAQNWSYVHNVPGRVDHNGSRCTPTVDEKYVYAMGTMGQLYCVNRANGKEVWKLDVHKTFDGDPPGWGFSQSPLMYKNMVIVAVMGKEVGLIALDKTSSREIWRSAPVGGESYVSAVVRNIAGVEGILFYGLNLVTFVAPDTGEVLWSYDGHDCGIPIPFPTLVSDDKLFITGGYGSGSVMIQVKKSGDGFKVNEVFRLKTLGAQIHPVLFLDGYMYGIFNNNGNVRRRPEGLVCMDLKGNVQWQTRKEPSFERGNFIVADGKFYIMDGVTGELAIAAVQNSGYRELARAKVLGGKGKNIWAPMALSDGRLIVRDQNEMKCLDVRAN